MQWKGFGIPYYIHRKGVLSVCKIGTKIILVADYLVNDHFYPDEFPQALRIVCMADAGEKLHRQLDTCLCCASKHISTSVNSFHTIALPIALQHTIDGNLAANNVSAARERLRPSTTPDV